MPIGIDTEFSSGLLKVIQERIDQVYNHKQTIEDDVLHNPEKQLIEGAIALLKGRLNIMPISWIPVRCRKMLEKSEKERIIIAAALLIAEYDRLEYLENLKNQAERV